MPSRAIMELAVPVCPRRRLVRKGQHGIHIDCAQPLKYVLEVNEWRCGVCGGAVAPFELLERRWQALAA